ncbi:DEKNAAC103091 [Brettanomyces naardenensis]|uniref:Mediator of RNA polymerase II transcription subunit 10 n=1 Tax=Brettanomyces naardenensis TaxID=13370 RepID=A0A448YMG6_BRENA|nr:DEKNAAC103091 [Brettanomyces naardenensis]
MTTESRSSKNSPLDSLQDDLSEIIETFVHLGVQVHDFQGTQEAKIGLANNINKVVSELQRLSDKPDLKNIAIPLDIINYVEDGRNPDIYTREFVEVVRKLNQYLNGKSLALQRFRDTLSTCIKQEFPELADEVENIKERTAS